MGVVVADLFEFVVGEGVAEEIAGGVGEEVGLFRVRLHGAVEAADDLLRGDVLVAVDRAEVDDGGGIFGVCLIAVFAEPEEFRVLAAMDDGVEGDFQLGGCAFHGRACSFAPGLLGAGDVGALGGTVLEGLDVFRGLGHGSGGRSGK